MCSSPEITQQLEVMQRNGYKVEIEAVDLIQFVNTKLADMHPCS